MENKEFTFELSLSILNHLGRNLYRNFVTVLGEAISNSWDADANNVWIYIDKDNQKFVIKDDGEGMTADDFQDKFLTVGYSKRTDNGMLSLISKRPYIGAKGIGKLALLSCSQKVSIISKTIDTEYTGGVIDNTGLTKAIDDNLKPKEYPLEEIDLSIFSGFLEGHKKGTVIVFEKLNEDIKNTIPYLKKLIALYFRFSLVDSSFKIFVNNDEVKLDDLKDFSENTEFIWNINKIEDPYIKTLTKLKNEPLVINNALNFKGFIATVEKPRNLKISGTEEKVGVDLFVNGRLRERDILKHLPDFSTRHIASYLYGQIHFDELEEEGYDRFTSSREGVVSGDLKYASLTKVLKEEILNTIGDKWDELRLDRGEDGDDENPRKSLKARRAGSLYNLSSKDYSSSNNEKVDSWVKQFKPEAEFNIPSYVDCFLSENLLRKYIIEAKIPLTNPAITEINQWKILEQQRKSEANISLDIRQNHNDLDYLGMDFLAKVIDSKNSQQNTQSLIRDSVEYKPMRNAIGHTALLTDLAKQKLNLVYENIKARLKNLLSNTP